MPYDRVAQQIDQKPDHDCTCPLVAPVTRAAPCPQKPGQPACRRSAVCGLVQANAWGVSSQPLCRCPGGQECPLRWDSEDGHSVTHGSDQYKVRHITNGGSAGCPCYLTRGNVFGVNCITSASIISQPIQTFVLSIRHPHPPTPYEVGSWWTFVVQRVSGRPRVAPPPAPG